MPIVIGALGTVPKRFVTGTGGLGNKKKWRPPKLQHC